MPIADRLCTNGTFHTLDADPFAVDPMAIADITVRATVVGGTTEFKA